MTKADIVNWILQNTNTKLSKKDVSRIVNAVFEEIEKEMTSATDEKKIQISGFGTFLIKKRAPKIGRNPRTKEETLIPERLGISFKPGKKLKEKIKAS
ncbi:MAG: integration host factor subunit beta [Aquificae bacterium]|nr:integration host factor subunit beta [Aquificota bacterium]